MKRRLLRRKIKNGGFTLVEVVIAMLLTAIIVSGVFSLALTIRSGNVQTDRKLIADQYARQLTSMLKSYVTADCTGNPATTAMAPLNASGVHSWSLSNVEGPGGLISDSCGASCYALESGYHVLTNFIPPAASNAELNSGSPYNAKICYNVDYGGDCSTDPTIQNNLATCSDAAVGGTTPCTNPPGYATAPAPPSVCVNAYWNEPAP